MLTLPRRRDNQLPLFEVERDRPLTMPGIRAAVGDFFEEMSRLILNGTRLATDSRADICPDIHVNPKLFAESKSIGNSGAIIVYAARLENDLAFVQKNGVDLIYCFWNHKARFVDGMTEMQVRDLLAASIQSVTLISLKELSTRLKATKLRALCRRREEETKGYGSEKYCMGYRLALSRVRKEMPLLGMYHGPEVYGRIAGPYEVYGEAGLEVHLNG